MIEMLLNKFCKFLLFLLPLTLFAKPITASRSHATGTTPLIVLDAGHGGFNLGAQAKFPYITEKKLALSTALQTKKYLEQLGYKVILTRSQDVFIPLAKRVYIANSRHAEIFVSVHFNSCPTKDISGIEVFYSDSAIEKKKIASRKLAHSLLSSIVARTSAKSRGVKRANFVVTRDTKMPAVLVEGGFMTNTLELNHLRQQDYLDKISKGIAEGIDKFIRLKVYNTSYYF